MPSTPSLGAAFLRRRPTGVSATRLGGAPRNARVAYVSSKGFAWFTWLVFPLSLPGRWPTDSLRAQMASSGIHQVLSMTTPRRLTTRRSLRRGGTATRWTIAGFTYQELRQLLKEQKGHRCCPSGADSKGVSHRRTSDACRIDWPTVGFDLAGAVRDASLMHRIVRT